MMLVTEDGTAYAEGFYKVEDGQVINPFTEKSVGVLVRTIPSMSYLCIERERRKPLWEQIYNYFATGFVRMAQQEDKVYTEYVREMQKGPLTDTMEALNDSQKG